jgi:hypothetical protein
LFISKVPVDNAPITVYTNEPTQPKPKELTMAFTVPVTLLAHGNTKVRNVQVPNVLKIDDRDLSIVERVLELVFHYGQNEVQSQQLPSVSVGDVIDYLAKHYIVEPAGFRAISTDEFNERYSAVCN